MSGDEALMLVVWIALSGFLWGGWLLVLLRGRALSPAPGAFLAPLVAVPVSGALLFALLTNFASSDVRDSTVYLSFYGLMGLAAIGLGVVALDKLGLSLRDDVLERRNPAACIAWAGALIGLTLAFAGANIGDGPGWWVVVFSSGLSIGALLLGWIVLDRFGEAGESIVVERDVAAGLRIAGWFVAVGAIVGRAAAGNWVSAEATVRDFCRVGVGALALTVLATVVEASLARRSKHASDWLPCGVLVAVPWIAFAVAYLTWIGHW